MQLQPPTPTHPPKNITNKTNKQIIKYLRIPMRCSTNWAMKPCWKQVKCKFKEHLVLVREILSWSWLIMRHHHFRKQGPTMKEKLQSKPCLCQGEYWRADILMLNFFWFSVKYYCHHSDYSTTTVLFVCLFSAFYSVAFFSLAIYYYYSPTLLWIETEGDRSWEKTSSWLNRSP